MTSLPLNVLMGAGGLVLLLAASELMVRELQTAGRRAGLNAGRLGLMVAIGADAPEITTALVALAAGSQSIGLGVVEGSNIYNFAGLLALGAIVTGSIVFTRGQIVKEGTAGIVVTALVVALVFLPNGRIPLALAALLGSVGFLLFTSHGEVLPREAGDVRIHVLRALLASLALVALTAVMVHGVIGVIHQLRLPLPLISILVLPVATSLPNTWAALQLARRHMGDAAISTAFNSNLINLAFGVALPSLFISFHPSRPALYFDGPYLLGMTAATALLCLWRSRLSRTEGVLIALMYGVFLAVRLGGLAP
ncbi:MAG TPA: hypothetical protein VFB34_00630 [Chloroflexota bacterium]|nr:hypothetical protein [Chloroflexota bacterium]